MNKLLVVIDMQNDFINGALGTAEATRIVDNVVDKIKSFEGDVVYTKDSHTADYLKTHEGRKLPVQHCLKGTDGWRLHPDIEKLFLDKQCKGFEKYGFGSKELPLWIEKNYPDGLEEIVLVGLCTDACIITNAMTLKTFFPETDITVDASCCAGISPEGHNTALNSMKTCQINVINE